MNKKKKPTYFTSLNANETDLTMFTITNLTLKEEENANMVYMALKLKRKVATELLTTYLPTILLLLITFVTIFFDRDLFGDVIAVNLTIMLVMTTIFTSKIEELPPTSDMKFIDIWLIFCLIVPFLEVILRTAIECVNCSCHICGPKEEDANKAKAGKEDKKIGMNAIQGASSGEVTRVWVGTGAKVAPQQVSNIKDHFTFPLSQILDQDKEKTAKVEDSKSNKGKLVGLVMAKERCWTGAWKRALEITGRSRIQ